MSILIKGMEMPKTGEYRCVIRKWGEEITVDLYGDEDLCGKLIPVPPHGRLIDADALFDFILNIYKVAQGDARKAYRDVLDTIVAAGDVIPAEEDENAD